jgi:ribosomal RNA-processing protein 12
LQTHLVLSAVEDTLRDQKTEFTPTAYFAALLSLLGQYISSKGVVNKDVATAVVYLLDLVTPHVPPQLLRSKFSQIIQKLATVLTFPDAEAPLLRPSIGCLESLLVVQDAQGWALSQSQISPRRAVAGLLSIAVDHRPKVRKRAQEAIARVLRNPPPSPSLDHPAADMCAETALRMLQEGVESTKQQKKSGNKSTNAALPNLIHTLQLIKTIAKASGGWPSRKIDSLCEALLSIARSTSEFLAMSSFEVFEVMFAGMADEVSSAKLPYLMQVLQSLQPSENDTQLLPPWLAVLSRGYDVSAQIAPQETFEKLPEIFEKVSHFMASMSYNIRVSAADCLISFLVNCIPASAIVEPSIWDEKTLEKISKLTTDLLTVKYQSAWMDAFRVLSALFETLRWRASSLLANAVKLIGQLRVNGSFNGKNEADAVLSKAIHAMGPDRVLEILPLGLATRSNEPGRVWLLPLLRDSVVNTKLAHFRSELVPLSEAMFQKVLDHGEAEKTVEAKIYETIVNQVWSALPGYCDLPIDLTEVSTSSLSISSTLTFSQAFDQSFAELISSLLYQQVSLRTDLCRGLQRLVDSNKERIAITEDDPSIALLRVSKADAERNLQHLKGFSGNLLAVLFNVYTQTLPQYRAPILQSINAYLSITSETDLVETFTRVTSMLESSLAEESQSQKEKGKSKDNQMPPTSHTLMDLVITMSAYLPRPSLAQLFSIATTMLRKEDANLQKKAYKLIPRLKETDVGQVALRERSEELQTLLLECAENTTGAARRDRLAAIATIVDFLPTSDLHFIPAVIPEITIATKETNEKARTTAFDLLISLGDKMIAGGTIVNSKVPHMPADAPSVPASLEEYFTMVSAGLAGTSAHAVSASITALTRILYHFRASISETMISELVQTMDTFLESPNREIVRSVLGFVKVSVISLPAKIVIPRLPTLIPNLLNWSHEHKAHLQAKVKHIFERMIRRFGVELVAKSTPEKDQKLITNIRKTRERRKKKKGAAGQDEDEEENGESSRPKSKLDGAFEEAVYGSDEDTEDSGSDVSDNEVLGKKKKKQGGEIFIVEDDNDPLDLLDRRALGNISSTRPVKTAPKQKRKAKTDLDGKLIINELNDTVMGNADGGAENGSVDKGDSIDAYVDALKGAHAPRRGQKGKLKFSNKVRDDDDDDDNDDVDVDLGQLHKNLKQAREQQKAQNNPARSGKAPRAGKGGIKAARMQRRGLGAEKTRGGRVMKGSMARVGRH